jgi:4-alpha-glucanotransferase
MADPATWGVVASFVDAARQPRTADPAAVAKVLEVMGAVPGASPAPAPLMTIRLDRRASTPALPAGVLTLEDGGTVRVGGALPPDLPAGYHRLACDEGPPLTVVASPGRAPLPPSPMWGWAAQLYATRSARSWGIGDLGDLERLVRWSESLGAGLVVVNPLHAGSPIGPQQASPYYPSSRAFASPLYLAVDELAGATGRPEVADAARAGRALNHDRLIDRDRVWALKSTALEVIYSGFAGDPAFDRYRAERGAGLTSFATYCALAERHGPRWPAWPEGLRHPDGPEVGRFAASAIGRDRIRYHQWLQWCLDRQMASAGGALPVMLDLAVGVDPGGADAWRWQDVFAPGMQVGAPPDLYNTRGQDWAVPPFDPWKVRAAGYEPWIESLRGALRHAGGLRVDHVMGLFRLYWIPAGSEPVQGVYVRYASRELLDILTLEAHRAGAFAVGEDLGTVETGVRRELAGRNVLSYKLWWFERRRPAGWPAKALGAISTHDLPTVAGVWSGADLRAERALNRDPDQAAAQAMRDRLARWTGMDPSAPVDAVIRRAHEELAQAPCRLLTASLDDALAVEERPNLPGTVDERPNWRLALPMPLEEIERAALPAAVAASLSRRGRVTRVAPADPAGRDVPPAGRDTPPAGREAHRRP